MNVDWVFLFFNGEVNLQVYKESAQNMKTPDMKEMADCSLDKVKVLLNKELSLIMIIRR